MKNSIKKRNILNPQEFALRMLRFFIYSFTLLTITLLIGIFGYHYIAELNWIDSLYNASMILAGMGPVNLLETDAAKFFASFYALLSGVVFLSTFALFFSPIAHRLLHVLHVDDEESENE